jgi:hypothetical protein
MPKVQTAIYKLFSDYKIAVTSINPGPFLATRMGLLDQLNHLLNFLAPAIVVGVVLAAVGPYFGKKSPSAPAAAAQAAINFIAGAVALALGLWFFGRDGKMATYAAMLVASASCQWWAVRGGR